MTHRSLALGALLAGTFLSSAVFAQSAETIPALRYRIDAQGVDHISGGVIIKQVEMKLGQDGPSGLELDQYYRGSAFGIQGSIGGAPTNWHLNLYKDASGFIHAAIGLTSDTFSVSGTTFTSVSGNGATLTLNGSVYTYTAADGTRIVYGYTNKATGDYYTLARASQVILPSGDVDTLAWNTTTYCSNNLDGCSGGKYITDIRLQSVTSSSGYQLHYNYLNNQDPPLVASGGPKWIAMSSVQGINLALDYCDPAAYTCTLSNQTAPSVGFSTSYPTGNSATTTVTDALGRHTIYHSDIGIFEIQKPSASSYDIVYTISEDGKLQVTQVVKDGLTYGYSPSLSGSTQTITTTDPLGHTTTTTANTSLQEMLSFTDNPQSGVSRTTGFTLDGSGRISRITYPEGNYAQYTYDGRGNLTQTLFVPKPGSGLSNITTSAVFPATCANPLTCNHPTSTTDANNHTTNYTYDPNSGQVATVTSPAVNGVVPQTRYTYTALQAYYKNSAGSIVASGVPIYKLTATSACRTTASCIGAADEVKSTITYGSTGVANNLLPTQVATGAGDGSLTATNSVTYDAVGNVATATDPLSNVTAYFFDADREPLGTIAPDPDGAGVLKMRATRLTYSADGLVTLTEQGTATANTLSAFNAMTTLQQVATAYDSADRKIQDSAQASGTTYAVVQYTYDAASRLQCSAQRMNPSVFSSLPSSACTLSTSGSFGPDRITYDSYDNANQLLRVTSGYGVTTANGFPATLQRDETTYTYSNNGKVKTLADAKGNLTTDVYDGFDRLSQTQYPSPATPGTSNTADYEQLGYDAASNLTSHRLRDGNNLVYGYDALNRMNSKTRLTTETSVTYTYDNLGHPLVFKQGNSSLITFGFDALGRETSEAQPYGTVSYQYDLAGDRTRLTWGDGIYVTFDYDAAHEMTAVHENGGTVIASLTYDDLGRRATRTYGSGAVSTYSYDAISRLTSIALTGASNLNTTTLSNYSPAGEIGAKANTSDTYAWTLGANANRGYTANGLNQYTAIAGSSVGYDAKGNITSLSGLTYTYSSENLLTSISTSTPTNFYYDALNRLVELDDSTANVRFVYDGDNIVQEVFLNGTVARRYVPGPLPNETLVWYDGTGTGTKRYFDQDERGSTTRVSNQSGTSWSIDSYDEYGTPGSNNSGRFEYTGYALMDTAGIYYAKARMYSPALGRFLQTDPIGYADGPNWYNYVGGNPINNIDPSGLDQCFDQGLYTISAGYNDDDGDIGVVGPQCGGPIDTGGGGGSVSGGVPSGGGSGGPAANPPITPPKFTWKNLACEAGNLLAGFSNATSTASNALTSAGLVTAGAGAITFQPEVVGAGLAITETGSLAGLASGGAELASGFLQGISGHGFGNALNGGASLFASYTLGKIFGPAIPAGYRTVSERASDNLSRNVSTIAGGLTGAVTGAVPGLGAQTVSCSE